MKYLSHIRITKCLSGWRKIKWKLRHMRAPCRCIPIITSHLKITDLARIVCDYLPKITDSEILAVHLRKCPFGMREPLNFRYWFLEKHTKYKNPFAIHSYKYFEIYEWRGDVFTQCDYTLKSNSLRMDIGKWFPYSHKIFEYSPIYSGSTVRIPHSAIESILKYQSAKYAFAMLAASVRMNRRIIQIIWGCGYRHA